MTSFPGWKTLQPRTTARSGDVNTDFSYIKDKPFIVPLAESTTTTISATYYNLTIDIASVGDIRLTDICDLLSLSTNAPIYDSGVLVVGKITDVPAKTVTFFRGVAATVTVAINDRIEIITPVHSTFADLPEDVFRTEFIDSFNLDYPWKKEDFSSTCNGVVTDFALTYAPVADSITVVMDSQVLFEGVSNDYTINYATNVITLAEPPIAGTLLFVKYQYVTGT